MRKKREPGPFFRAQTGTWYVQFGRRQINLGSDKNAAWNEYHRLMTGRHNIDATADATVCAVLDAFLDWLQDWRAAGTYRFYREHLNRFAKFIGPRLKLIELREKHVTTWIDQQHQGFAPDTIHGAIRSVQRAMNWAVKRGFLTASPLRHIEKPAQQPREVVITPDQFEQFLARCSDQPARDLFTVLWETGCRVQEIRIVEARHFFEAERCWRFPREKSKGKRAQRTIYLTDEAFEITKRLAAKHPEGALFRNSDGEAWTKNAIVLRFRKIAKPPGKKCTSCDRRAAVFVKGRFVPAGEKLGRKWNYACDSCLKRRNLDPTMVKPLVLPIAGLEEACATSFRHSFATRALKNRVAGITVSILMGHADTRMIERVYSHLEQDPAFLQQELTRATATNGKVG